MDVVVLSISNALLTLSCKLVCDESEQEPVEEVMYRTSQAVVIASMRQQRTLFIFVVHIMKQLHSKDFILYGQGCVLWTMSQILSLWKGRGHLLKTHIVQERVQKDSMTQANFKVWLHWQSLQHL